MLDLEEGEKIDWFRILMDLRYIDVPIQQIHRDLNIPAGTIKAWCYGFGRPVTESGIRMINYWSEKTGNPPDMIPTCYDVPRRR